MKLRHTGSQVQLLRPRSRRLVAIRCTYSHPQNHDHNLRHIHHLLDTTRIIHTTLTSRLTPPKSESEIPTNRPWQTFKKRKRTYPPTETAIRGHLSPFNSLNQFENFSHLSDDDIQTSASDPHATTNSGQNTQTRVHKPPPIYVYGVTNHCDIVKYLTKALEEEQYYCKALLNKTVKINVNTSESYRKLIKRLQDDKIVHIPTRSEKKEPIGWSYVTCITLSPQTKYKPNLNHLGTKSGMYSTSESA